MNHTDSRPVTIACAANGRYALPLAVMLRSVQANLDPSRSLAIFIVDDGLTADDRQRVLASLLPGPAVHWVRPQRPGFAKASSLGKDVDQHLRQDLRCRGCSPLARRR